MYAVVRYNVEIVFGWCVERVSGFGCVFFTFFTFYSRLHSKNSILCVCLLTVGIQNTDKSTSNFDTKLLAVGEHCDEFHLPPSLFAEEICSKFVRRSITVTVLFSCVF